MKFLMKTLLTVALQCHVAHCAKGAGDESSPNDGMPGRTLEVGMPGRTLPIAPSVYARPEGDEGDEGDDGDEGSSSVHSLQLRFSTPELLPQPRHTQRVRLTKESFAACLLADATTERTSLPESMKAIILGMCYAASDAELANLKEACDEIREVVDSHPAEFVKQMQWVDFHASDKGFQLRLAATGEGHTTAAAAQQNGYKRYGTIRAARWSLPGGRASATVRVDDLGQGIEIGVLTDRFTHWDGWMFNSHWAWCYEINGCITHNFDTVDSISSAPRDRLVTGTVMTVTLDAHHVTFSVNGNDHTITLPDKCGNISLGVALGGNAKVTLLPESAMM